MGGVDTRWVKWVPYDGLGRSCRNGLNFTEAGYGVRGAVGCSDRGHTAVSQLKAGDIDWDGIFAQGVRWFHCGGIFAALSVTTPEVAMEDLKAAKKHGTVTSYDLNYRPSLWKEFGGQAKAQEVNRELAKYVDVMIGNEEDFTACLGYKIEGVDSNLSALDPSSFQKMIEQVVKDYPISRQLQQPCEKLTQHHRMVGVPLFGMMANSTKPKTENCGFMTELAVVIALHQDSFMASSWSSVHSRQWSMVQHMVLWP